MRLAARLPLIVRDWTHAGLGQVAAAFDRTPPSAFAAGHRTPIVLLPGIFEPWRYLLPLARRLNAAGHPVYPQPILGWNAADLDASVARVAGALADVPTEGAVLVAHSKGGLIGKRLLGRPELAGVRGMVALCTPFGGSSLAWPLWGPTPLGMFAPTGPVIMALAAERLVNARITSISSAWDEVIPNGSRLDGARNLTAPVAGHFLPAGDPRVADLIAREVERLASR